VLDLIARLTGGREPLDVIDTHAGAGLYDLQGSAAQMSGEAKAGIVRLMGDEAASAVFAPLKAAVLAANPKGQLRFYPGSPTLIVRALRSGDSYAGCELRPDDFDQLSSVLCEQAPRKVRAEALKTDGYAIASRPPPSPERPALILIDPPFERGDEYRRIAETVEAAARSRRRAVLAIWAPLKDLETFDGLLRSLQDLALPSMFAAQLRLRPLRDPMRMNGCAMIVSGAPQAEETAREVCDWIAAHLGEPGGSGRVERLTG